MPDDTAEALRQQLATMSTVERRVREWTLAGETDIALPVLLAEDETGRTYAVLRRPLAQVLAPYYRLRKALLVLTIASLAIAILASVPMAASVTRPVQKLLAGVRHVQSGDYEKPVDIRQQDEIGELASAFNDMTLGLAERDKVRNLLGKVVDPAVAGELLARGVDLGGEEREATILFCDLRDFTAFSETLPPRDLLNRLNDYLTRMTAVIEAEGGIIDKYIGDAIMAIYGAPLAHGDDPARAVRAALGMQQALHELNSELTGAGLPAFDFGIGINTARVVAGNMGSATRLNYTVIGDGVNLAARIEGLTKEYGEPVIVSEGTRAAVVDIAFMELDQVQVKGRQESVRIYAPLGPVSTLSAEVLAQLSRHEEALALYRDRQWQAAADLFEGLRRAAPRRIHDIYIQRCQRNMAHPPTADWQPVVVYERK
jgi:adenylate cyclase